MPVCALGFMGSDELGKDPCLIFPLFFNSTLFPPSAAVRQHAFAASAILIVMTLRGRRDFIERLGAPRGRRRLYWRAAAPFGDDLVVTPDYVPIEAALLALVRFSLFLTASMSAPSIS